MFHPIARALLIREGKILVAHCKGARNTFLPGGHIRAGERTVEALKRELFEELGVRIVVGDYLGAIEHRWIEGDVNHEINHVFKCECVALRSLDVLASHEDYLEFHWKRPEELVECNLLPTALIPRIKSYLEGDRRIWWNSYQ